jgi:hypothetical protein
MPEMERLPRADPPKKVSGRIRSPPGVYAGRGKGMSEREVAPAWRGGSSSNRNRDLNQKRSRIRGRGVGVPCLDVGHPGPDNNHNIRREGREAIFSDVLRGCAADTARRSV